MKKYTIKLTLIFIISYVLMLAIVGFMYVNVFEKHFTDRAEISVANQNNSISSSITHNLNRNYVEFIDLVEEAKLSVDPIGHLNANKENIQINEEKYIGFGKINVDSYEIDGTIYSFNDAFKKTDYYNQNFSVFAFKQVFVGQTNETLHGFFKHDDIIAYFDISSYLSKIMISEINASSYFIISRDGNVFMNEDKIGNDKFGVGFSNNKIKDKFFEDLNEGKNGAVKTKYIGSDVFVSYAPIAPMLSTTGLYFIQNFVQKEVLGNINQLPLMLIATLILVTVVLSLGMVFLYRIILKRSDDVEVSRLNVYYSKPYILHITDNGKVKGYNVAFKKTFTDFKKYKNVKDLPFVDFVNLNPIENFIGKQGSFNVNMSDGMTNQLVHFIILKTGNRYSLLGENITDSATGNETAIQLAYYNDITKTLNYNGYIKETVKLFGNQEFIKQKHSLLLFDIISYKEVNQFISKSVVDRLMLVIVDIIKNEVRDFNAHIYHVDKESFVIMFENVNSYEQISKWAERFINIMSKPIPVGHNMLNVDIKIGIFNIQMDMYDSLTPESAYKNALMALDRAKSSKLYGKIVYNHNLGSYITRKEMIEKDLEESIKKQEFEMFLQPQYNIKEERVVGFEALVRWTNPKYKNESPALFIPIAEENDMILDIGKIVIAKTFRVAKEFEKYKVKISMNVSPAQLLQAGFVDELLSAFKKNELKSGSICIEITETHLMTSFNLIIEKLKNLVKNGFDVHLDDFGTGYSSLLYLKELPINTIKIDREFVKDLTADIYSKSIVNMILGLSKSLGLSVIAEGVEDEKQIQFLHKGGCNLIQGYYVSKPLNQADAIDFLKNQRNNYIEIKDESEV